VVHLAGGLDEIKDTSQNTGFLIFKERVKEMNWFITKNKARFEKISNS
jgi:hypothetical protein